MIIFAKSQHFTVCWFGHFSLLKLNKSSPLVADRVLNAKWMYKIYLKAGMQRQKFIKYRATFMHAFDTCWNSFGQLNFSSFFSVLGYGSLDLADFMWKNKTNDKNQKQCPRKQKTNERKKTAQIWKVKKTQLNDVQCIFFRVLPFPQHNHYGLLSKVARLLIS